MSLVTLSQLLQGYRLATDADFVSRADKAVRLVCQYACPDYVSAVYSPDFSGGKLSLRGLTLPGKDIYKHLYGSAEVAVCACTLGVETDNLLERLKLSDLALAYLVDEAASLAVDNLAEECWRGLCAGMESDCTTRFSCGYGDFDISFQPQCLALCGADVRTGILVNNGGMMYPTKSITFLCGLGTGNNSI